MLGFLLFLFVVMAILFWIAAAMHRSAQAAKPVDKIGNTSIPDLQTERTSSNSEEVWNIVFGQFRSSKLDNFLLKQRELYEPLSAGKNLEEKCKLLSKLEFDRIDGQTILRKQSNQEKIETVALLDFKFTTPDQVFHNLRDAFAPRKPYFRILLGEIEYASTSWQKEILRSHVEKGLVISGGQVDLDKLLENLSVAELKTICDQNGLKSGGRKQPMIKAIREKGISYENISHYFRGTPFQYKSPAPEHLDRVTTYWDMCERYLSLSRLIDPR